MSSSRLFTLTPEQRSAVEVDGSAVVCAGAGSGKTAVLAARYIHLLEQGMAGGMGRCCPLKVEEILAITFTDKAASEMKDRIRALLAARVLETEDHRRQLLERAQRELVAARICTIHSFCAHLLRENPLDAGIDPSASVLDQREAEDYLEKVVERELRQAIEAGNFFARRLAKTHSLAGATSFLRHILEDLSRTDIRAGDLRGLFMRQLKEGEQAKKRLAREVGEFCSSIEHWLEGSGSGSASAELEASWPYWRDQLFRLPRDPRASRLLGLEKLASMLPTRRRGGEALAGRLRRERGVLKGVIVELAGFISSLPATGDAVELLARIRDAAREAKRSDGVMTFDDLICSAQELLDSNEAVLARYQQRYRAVLVDEFQDTDARQGEVIRLLAEGGGTSLFLVGDERQSIYGFRGADVEVMGRFRSMIGKDRVLKTNFRSRPGVLRFVNALASRAMQPRGHPVPPYWVRWSPELELRAARDDGPGDGVAVTLISLASAVSCARLDARGAREIEADLLASRIVKLCSNGPTSWRDIAILLRATTEIKIYENALRRYSIPYQVIKGGRFFQTQEICDLISLVSAVDDPADDQALAALLRSPFFALSDDSLYRLATAAAGSLAEQFSRRTDFADLGEDSAAAATAQQLLGRWRRVRDRLTVAEIVEVAVRERNLEAVLLGQAQGEQKVANVRKFIELARQVERSRRFTLSEFVKHVRDLLARGSGEPEASVFVGHEDVVNLMSVHQAKGLEFPVVIVPDLSREVRDGVARVVVDPGYGILVVDEVGVASRPLEHALVNRRREEDRDRGRAESVRLLYVALTRARDNLILSEGKSTVSFLRSSRPPHSWLEHIWDLIGRQQMLHFVESDASKMVAKTDGGSVRIEKAPAQRSLLRFPAKTVRLATDGSGTEAQDIEQALVRVAEFKPPGCDNVTLSPVEISRFDQCPRMYYLAKSNVYVERPQAGAPGLGPQAGTIGHSVLQWLNPLKPAGDLKAEIEKLVASSGGSLLLPAIRAELEQTLFDSIYWIASRYSGVELLGQEIPFALSLGGDREGIVLRGRIDFLGQDTQGLIMADYKFASARGTKSPLYEMQLAAYATAVRRLFPEAKLRCEILYLGAEKEAVTLDNEQLASTQARLRIAAESLVDTIATPSLRSFPKKGRDPTTCRSWKCSYIPRCW